MILGSFLALFSAMSFSMNSVLVRRGMTGGTASQGAFVTVLIGVPLFLVAALVSGQILRGGDVPLTGYLLLSGAGILHFGVGRYFNYRAIGAIGSARSQPVQTLNIPYSIGIAWIFLGESITWLMAIAILFILAGPAIIIERPKRTPTSIPRGGAQGAEVTAAQAFQLRQVEGYITAILAGICYGTSPILIRAALEGQTGLSVFGGMVAYIATATVLLASLALPGRRDLIRAINLRSFRLFFGAGFFVWLAQMLRFIALSMAPVAVVGPLQRLTALFTLGLSATMNRGLEKITWRLVVGIVVSVTGSVLLVFAGTTR